MPLRRFDDALMQPPDATAGIDAAVNQRVRPWCEAGAFADPMVPLSAACIGTTADAPALDGLASELDGSKALARLPRWRGLAWRLRLQLRERLRSHRARPTDPWDCGWWRPGAFAAAAAFRPRRPTLLMVRAPSQAEANELLATLLAQSDTYHRPLRVLFAMTRPPHELWPADHDWWRSSRALDLS